MYLYRKVRYEHSSLQVYSQKMRQITTWNKTNDITPLIHSLWYDL